MALSASASALAGRLLGDNPLPMLWIMTVISLLSLGLALHVRRLGRNPVQPRDAT